MSLFESQITLKCLFFLFSWLYFLQQKRKSLPIQQASLGIVINNNSISEQHYVSNKSYTNLIRVCSECTVIENTGDCAGHLSYCCLWSKQLAVRLSVL